MLEQTSLNGVVYLSLELEEKGKTKLVTKNAILTNIQFGPYKPIIIHQNPRTEVIMIEYPEENNAGYLYQREDNQWNLIQEVDAVTQPDDITTNYLYGMAIYKDTETTYTVPYMIQNEPNVTLDITPDINVCSMPPTMTGYPYDIEFTYKSELIDLIGHLTATYADKYKRPLNPSFIKGNKYFPTSVDNLTTTVSDICKVPKKYPVVVMLNKHADSAEFACIDLEPGYTPEELEVAESFDAYYKEDTPRGGKHYLVKPNKDNTEFKYRISKQLEVQVHCLITFYGINGQFLNSNPSETSFEQYDVVGHQSTIITTTDAPDNVSEIVDELMIAITKLGTTGKIKAIRAYKTIDDISRADFTAIARLYNTDIKPFESDIPKDSLPWVLAEYASLVIPARLKHSTSRNGVPYLVYLANIITSKETKND